MARCWPSERPHVARTMKSEMRRPRVILIWIEYIALPKNTLADTFVNYQHRTVTREKRGSRRAMRERPTNTSMVGLHLSRCCFQTETESDPEKRAQNRFVQTANLSCCSSKGAQLSAARELTRTHRGGGVKVFQRADKNQRGLEPFPGGACSV